MLSLILAVLSTVVPFGTAISRIRKMNRCFFSTSTTADIKRDYKA